MFHLPQSSSTYSNHYERPRQIERAKAKRRRQPNKRPITDGMLSTTEVAERAGVSLRQLQWWDERDVIRPHLNRGMREYSATDLRAVVLVAELRRKGLSLQQVRRGLRLLRQALSGSYAMCAGGHWSTYRTQDSALQGCLAARTPVVIVEVP